MAFRRRSPEPSSKNRIARAEGLIENLKTEIADAEPQLSLCRSIINRPVLSPIALKHSRMGWAELSPDVAALATDESLFTVKQDMGRWVVTESKKGISVVRYSSNNPADAFAEADKWANDRDRLYGLPRRPARNVSKDVNDIAEPSLKANASKLKHLETLLRDRGAFHRTFRSDDIKRQIQHLRIQRRLLEKFGRRVQNDESKLLRLKLDLTRSLNARDTALSQIAAAAARADRRKQREALLARATDRDRDLAATLRRRLPRDHPCPYCDRPLGHDAHLDHIYPLALGGLGVVRNLVYACRSCNSKKGDSTINQFVEKHGLDRERVFARLRSLGKQV